MADIAARLLSDMSKVQNSSNGRGNAKSRAKQENKQQMRVLTNFAKALGSTALSAFSIKVRKASKISSAGKSSNQRVTIKSSYTIEQSPYKAKMLAKAHINYITRDSAGSEPFSATDKTVSKADLDLFIEGSPDENKKMFRFIISPENAKDFESDDQFKNYIQECMKQLSADLPGKPDLNYTANIHHDTANPHCHVYLKGISKTGQDITIPKEYIKTTFREKSESLATYYLGHRTPEDIQDAKLSEITAKRLTSIDFDIIRNAKDNVFNSKDYDKATKTQEHRLTTFIIPRLDYLCKIGLVTKNKTKYTLDPEYKVTLQDMPLNNDIIKKLARLKKAHFIEKISKYDAYNDNKPITGIVIEKAYDEESLLNYAIILDYNKKSHYVKLGKSTETEGNECTVGSTVELTTKAFTSKTGQEFKNPYIRVLSLMSHEKQVNHPGITDLDRLIASNNFTITDPNIYQQQQITAIQARIDRLLSEKQLYLINGKYRFKPSFWLDAEKTEHSTITRNFDKITYKRLSEKEVFVGRVVATKAFGNETHAIVSNGKEFIVIPIRGKINKINDKTTQVEVTMNFERKGYSSPIYGIKLLTLTNELKPQSANTLKTN